MLFHATILVVVEQQKAGAVGPCCAVARLQLDSPWKIQQPGVGTLQERHLCFLLFAIISVARHSERGGHGQCPSASVIGNVQLLSDKQVLPPLKVLFPQVCAIVVPGRS